MALILDIALVAQVLGLEDGSEDHATCDNGQDRSTSCSEVYNALTRASLSDRRRFLLRSSSNFYETHPKRRPELTFAALRPDQAKFASLHLPALIRAIVVRDTCCRATIFLSTEVVSRGYFSRYLRARPTEGSLLWFALLRQVQTQLEFKDLVRFFDLLHLM